MTETSPYQYSGARNLVILHERHMREFLRTWRVAKDLDVVLPETDDEDYASLETILRHVLGAAAWYMTWSCECLNLPDPKINKSPALEEIGDQAESYLEHVLDGWRGQLQDVPEEAFYRPEYPSAWKVLFCVDAMLEHAVMHPIRHTYQLEQLILAASARS